MFRLEQNYHLTHQSYGNHITLYKGSLATAHMVATQIAERFGDAEVTNYNPEKTASPIRNGSAEAFKCGRANRA